MPDFGKNKNVGRAAGGSKKAENIRAANRFAALLTTCAPASGQAFAPANNAVMMTSGAAHGRESPNSTDGGLAASQTNHQAAMSNARRFPFNTSCDRALSTAAMPGASTSVAGQSPANAGGRGTRRDAAAAAAALANQQSVVTQRVAFNAGCGPATVASLGNNGAG